MLLHVTARRSLNFQGYYTIGYIITDTVSLTFKFFKLNNCCGLLNQLCCSRIYLTIVTCGKSRIDILLLSRRSTKTSQAGLVAVKSRKLTAISNGERETERFRKNFRMYSSWAKNASQL